LLITWAIAHYASQGIEAAQTDFGGVIAKLIDGFGIAVGNLPFLA
jgi:hypothetical protein